VVYWMSRDQRADDNWALIYAVQAANERKVPLCVVFCLVPEYLGTTERQYDFMVRGLRQLEPKIKQRGIGFYLLEGFPGVELPSFLHNVGAGMLITDFEPLRIKKEWKKRVVGALDIPVIEVDAHNIVPCRIAAKRRMEAKHPKKVGGNDGARELLRVADASEDHASRGVADH